MSLSVVINTRNAATTLEGALKSVQGIADEIVVVDMLSTDETLDIARKYTTKVFSLDKDYSYVEPARNIALSKAQGSWILVLDADEELTPKLAQEIKNITHSDKVHPKTSEAYRLPRCNIIFGQWLQHTGWWPDYQLRLFRSGTVTWLDEIHSTPEVQGTVADLPAKSDQAILHHNYQTVSQYVERLNRYTTIENQKKVGAGSSDNSLSDNPSQLLSEFFADFLRRFFAQKGYEEGMHGAGLSLLQSMYQAVSILKRWEKSGFSEERSESVSDTMNTLHTFTKELNYWLADWHCQHTSGLTQIYWRVRRKLLL